MTDTDSPKPLLNRHAGIISGCYNEIGMQGFMRRLVWRSGLALVLCECVAISAETVSNTHKEIATKFHESEPDSNTSAVATVPQGRPPTVKLTGMVMVLSKKRVMLEIQMNGQTVFPYLGEGQSHSGVEILAIDENTQSVRISNQGMLATLTVGRSNASSARTSSHVPLQTKPLVNGPAHQELVRPNVVPPTHW